MGNSSFAFERSGVSKKRGELRKAQGWAPRLAREALIQRRQRDLHSLHIHPSSPTLGIGRQKRWRPGGPEVYIPNQSRAAPQKLCRRQKISAKKRKKEHVRNQSASVKKAGVLKKKPASPTERWPRLRWFRLLTAESNVNLGSAGRESHMNHSKFKEEV